MALRETLGALEGGLGQLGEPVQEHGREAVDAQVGQRCDLARVARKGNGAAREVQGPSAVVEHHLDHARLVRLVRLERARGSGHLRALPHQFRHRGNGAWIDERLVALDVEVRVGDDHLRGLRDPLGAVARLSGHDRAKTRGGDRVRDARIVGRHGDFIETVGARHPLAHAHDHRRAAQVGEGFSRQALG